MNEENAAMKRVAMMLALLLLIASPTVLPACAGTSKFDEMSGAEIFENLCATCHGPEGRAMTGVANSYVGKREFWTEEKLLQFVDNPQAYRRNMPHLMAGQKRRMPPLSRSVSPEARRRLVAHVLGQMEVLEGNR